MTQTQRHTTATKATLAGIVDRFRSRKGGLALRDGDRLDGRVCLVTGANAGLGKAVASQLGQRGASVMMAGRTVDERARDEVAEAAGHDRVMLEHLDLADLASVRAFCERQRQAGARFDVTVLNAGIVARQSRRTGDGLDEGFQVNYLANFELLRGLLGAGVIPNATFAVGGAVGRDVTPRIVFVSSESHRSAPALDWGDFGAYREYGMGATVAEYGKTKLLLSTLAVELARRLAPGGAIDVAVHHMCPGAVNTRLAREAPAWAKPLLWLVFAAFFRAPNKAAEPVVYLCCSEALAGRTGVYMHLMAEKEPSSHALDEEAGRLLWDASEALLGSYLIC